MSTSNLIHLPTPSANLAKERVRVRCGDCAHFKGHPNPAVADVPCNQTGVLATKLAPPCYTPDFVSLRSLGQPSLLQLQALLTTMKPKQLRVFVGLLTAASSLERYGLSFMQTVYFQVGGVADSLENMYQGFALSVMPDKQIAVVGSSYLTGRDQSCIAVLYADRLMTEAKFMRHVRKLTREGKVHAPAATRSSLQLAEELGIPTMDTSLEELERRAKKSGSKRVKKDVALQGRTRQAAPAETDEEKPAPRKSRSLFKIEG